MSMSGLFHVGQTVVCVDDALHPEWQPTANSGMLHGLKTGASYHIAEVRVQFPMNMVRLEEIKRPGLNQFYFHARFRPVVPKPDAIEWARAMCRVATAEEADRIANRQNIMDKSRGA